MPDLRQLRQFVAVAEELHFHRAAARLNMSQPPLTTAIRKLEEEIGVDLIDRSNRTIGLTAAGTVFLDEARRTLRQAERAVAVTRDTAAGQTGVVRIGYVGSALYGRLPDTIRAFRRSQPDVRLELIEATSARQVSLVREGGIDVGLVIPPISDAADLTFSRFDGDDLAIAVPRTHPLAAEPSLAVADLADRDFILWPQTEGRGFHLKVIGLCTAAGFVPKVAQEAHGMHAVLSLVAVEAGVSIVPRSMSGFRSDRIAYHAIRDDDARFDLAFCYRDAGDNPALRRFLDLSRRGTAV